MNDSFLFYKTWQDVLLQHPGNIRLEVLDAIISYATTGAVPQLSDVAAMAFSFIRSQIDANEKRYNDVCQKRRRAIQRRWEKKKVKDTNVTNVSSVNDSKQNDTTTYNSLQQQTNDTYNDNDNELYKTHIESMNNDKEIDTKVSISQKKQKNAREQQDEWIEKIKRYFNNCVEACGTKIKPIGRITEKRHDAMLYLGATYGSQAFAKAIKNFLSSSYANGKTRERQRPADFDWFLREENFIRALENSL